MGVQHGPRAAHLHDLDVKPGFRRRPPRPLGCQLPCLIDLDDAVGGQLTFGDPAGRNRQTKRLAVDDHAEIPARPENPPASVEAAAYLSQLPGGPAEL
jgi:hypothetical protein